MRATLLTTLTLVAGLSLPAQAETLFAAIAFSPTTGYSGGAWNYADSVLAEDNAYLNCGYEDCGTVVVFNQCGAIAVGAGYGYGFYADPSEDTATSEALRICGTYTTACEVTLSFCNAGS